MSIIAAGKSEQGAVAVLYAITMLVMLGVLAIVVDLGAVRADGRAAQLTADMAATAGAAELMPDGGSPQEACRAAVDYVVENTPNMGHPGYGSCDSFPATGDECRSLDPNYAERLAEFGDADPYAVTIRWPVDLDDGGLAYDSELDGHRCERLSVHVSRTRGFVFGQVLGQSEGGTGAPAVALAQDGSYTPEIVNLLLLDKFNCTALDTSGGGRLQLKSVLSVDPETGDDKWILGRAHIDSSGRDCGPGVTIRADGGGWIRAEGDTDDPPAPGQIGLYALPPGATSCDQPAGLTADGRKPSSACRSADVTTNYNEGNKIWPQPTHLPQRMNRTPADHAFNCKSDYSSLDGQAPGSLAWDVLPCQEATGDNNHIDNVMTAFGNASSPPAGFNVWRTEGYSCNYNSNAGPIPAGNWYIDCPGPGGLRVTDTLTFQGGNLVFQHQLNMGPGGRFEVNTANPDNLAGCLDSTSAACLRRSSPSASYMYFGAGGIDQTTSAQIELPNTTVVLRNGTIKVNNGTINWKAPYEGPFENLALWTARSRAGTSFDDNSMAGGATVRTEGVFFAPNSLFTVTGGGAGNPDAAQFFVWRLRVPGGGALTLTPDPQRALTVPVPGGIRLVR